MKPRLHRDMMSFSGEVFSQKRHHIPHAKERTLISCLPEYVRVLVCFSSHPEADQGQQSAGVCWDPTLNVAKSPFLLSLLRTSRAASHPGPSEEREREKDASVNCELGYERKKMLSITLRYVSLMGISKWVKEGIFVAISNFWNILGTCTIAWKHSFVNFNDKKLNEMLITLAANGLSKMVFYIEILLDFLPDFYYLMSYQLLNNEEAEKVLLFTLRSWIWSTAVKC